MNIYGEDSGLSTDLLTLINVTLDSNKAFKVISFIGYGDAPGEFDIFINNNKVGGCRTSNEIRTIQIFYDGAIILNPSDALKVTAKHYVSDTQYLRCNLIMKRI